jgi:hypothetical protein
MKRMCSKRTKRRGGKICNKKYDDSSIDCLMFRLTPCCTYQNTRVYAFDQIHFFTEYGEPHKKASNAGSTRKNLYIAYHQTITFSSRRIPFDRCSRRTLCQLPIERLRVQSAQSTVRRRNKLRPISLRLR